MNRGKVRPRLPRPAALAALMALATGAATAQSPAPAAGAAPATPPMASPAAPAVFPIRGFVIEGENPIGEAEASRALAPYVRPDATLETLQQATAALEKALRDAGYGLHRVALPPQEVGATVKLNIVKFTIGKVEIEGRQIYSEANIRHTVPELRENESPNFKRLAIQTAIANENPNKQIQVGLRESEEPDHIDASINVREQRPWTFGASLSNAGTKETGRDRFTVYGGHTNLFDLDHQVVFAYTTSFESMDDVRQFGLAYKVPLYEYGGVIGASYTNSDVVGDFGSFRSTGAGQTFGLTYTWYLPPQGGRRSYVTFGFDDKVFDASKVNDTLVPGALDRRSRPLSVGYTARTETDTTVWGYDVSLAANTGTGDHNDLASYQSEDPRIETVHWKAVRGGGSYASQLTGGWLWTARGLYQYSPDVLISGEQFGLGGVSSVRGTEIERPISGDSGVSATLEVSTPEVFPGLRFLGFMDGGYLWNNQPNGTTKPASDRIASLGLGFRYLKGNFSFSADYGRLVVGSKVPLAFNSSSPQSGEDRFYVNLGVRF
ncbi:ShlB/FhaC/HecB family hemolysin secretion/activation protein [Ramlibacter sp. G-1-2-2]|uniref:ShlB/FhaC/HecB family hemolysin secretion/activation protein n=1 Tax=Ramlibacter agri TaxID=2728837 RepID=A0A848GZN9_9BURK|nr:ShlB/FhaC/HecB family hemolysin secretion/activation protein [Ramlibacter agri]NML43784.1 ShlB/FhaC/HecB family hemolysin secretion/activation protein [Ramlibacter agri]